MQTNLLCLQPLAPFVLCQWKDLCTYVCFMSLFCVCIFYMCRVLPIMSSDVLSIKLALHLLWLSHSHSFSSWNEYGAKVSESFMYTEAFTRVTQVNVHTLWGQLGSLRILFVFLISVHGSRISLTTGITKSRTVQSTATAVIIETVNAKREKARRVFTAGKYLSELIFVTRTVI